MLKRFWQRYHRAKRQGMSRAELLELFRAKYGQFTALLAANAAILTVIAEIEETLRGREAFGLTYIRNQAERVKREIQRMIESFEALSGRCYLTLHEKTKAIDHAVRTLIDGEPQSGGCELVLSFNAIGREMVDTTGGKSANLGEIHSRARLPVPGGFAITTAAFRLMLTESGLDQRIQELTANLDGNALEDLTRVSDEIGRLFDAAEVPAPLASALHGAFDSLAEASGRHPRELTVALRSSAVGEDSELSFAGQYLSVLNVGRDRVLRDYKRVLASLYSAQALAYRLNHGIRLDRATMGVACLEMIAAKASGVAYTRHPFRILEDHVIINAVWGLGLYAVDGIVTPDSYSFSKDEIPQMLGCRIHDKAVRLVSGEDGQLVEQPVEPRLRKRACLSEEQSRELVRHALRLESHFGSPQDIEWALDQSDRLLILQARPLRLEGTSSLQDLEELQELSGPQLLLSGGDIASPGVGCGPVFLASDGCDLLAFPAGGVLVAAHPSPRYGMIMTKAQAIVTDTGSVTGHMASLAREYHVPTVLNARNATRLLISGTQVTVDAYTGKVYRGEVPQLLSLKLDKGCFMTDSPVYAALRSVADLIVPLHLTDPAAADFSPAGCQTIHDITRLLHEWSYQEVFRIGDLAANGEQLALKLDAAINLDLWVIDLGGGLAGVAPHARKLGIDQVTSKPFGALLRGLVFTRPVQPRAVDVGGFFSVMSRQMMSPPNQAGERFGEKSYAIVSDRYLNFSSRVGYHYSVLDCYCGQTTNKNYINFEFKGGAADEDRRNRRARAITMMLQQAAFEVLVTGDRVRARFAKRNAEETERQLEMVGRLLQYTRQMDMLMHSDAAVEQAARAFHDGHDAFHGPVAAAE